MGSPPTNRTGSISWTNSAIRPIPPTTMSMGTLQEGPPTTYRTTLSYELRVKYGHGGGISYGSGGQRGFGPFFFTSTPFMFGRRGTCTTHHYNVGLYVIRPAIRVGVYLIICDPFHTIFNYRNGGSRVGQGDHKGHGRRDCSTHLKTTYSFVRGGRTSRGGRPTRGLVG